VKTSSAPQSGVVQAKLKRRDEIRRRPGVAPAYSKRPAKRPPAPKAHAEAEGQGR
jgi:hypothetical protein